MTPGYYPIDAATLRWLYVDFNSYFASVEQQINPALRGRPVAVVPVETEATCAIAASYEAKAYGVKTGTPIWEAKKKCPGLVCVLARHEHYVEYHQRILEEINQHIPVTAVCSIDEMACRLMDNETSVERSTQIAHSIKRGLAANVGEFVKCSIGIAPNRYLAKVATDIQKPDGLTFLHGHELPGKLLDLKLKDLPGIGHNMEKRLLTAGIVHVRALWALEPKRMRSLWGNVGGEKLWYLLRGAELPDEETTRSTIGHSHVLAPDLRSAPKARYVARRLLLKAASRMRRMQYYATALSFAVRLEDGPRLEGGEQFYRARDSFTLVHILDWLWEQLQREVPKARIKKVSVVLHGLVPESDVQPELLDALPESGRKARQKAEHVSDAMDKINRRFGRDSISMGLLPSQGRSFSGTKVAFTRIPDMEEFLE